MIKQSTEDQLKRWRGQIFLWIPVLAVCLAMMTFLLNYGVLWSIQHIFQPSETAGTEVYKQALQRQIADSEARQKALTDRLSHLEAELPRYNTSGPPTGAEASLVRRIDLLESSVKQLDQTRRMLRSPGQRRGARRH